jgi:hypothetical protein
MMASSKRFQERGMAMLVALFTIVLLSVIGLGLMYSTNMETLINSNYRDKQLATYAALSGTQEARDRLQPAAPKVTVPTDVPTLTNHMVIYIINPSGGETVAPWDPSSNNPYKDTELCQEGILGLTPTPGIPCANLPTGSDWYTVVDNSDPANAPWNLSTPLEVKWTRLLLKANTSTPVVANGNPAVTTQTCWDGYNQIIRPAGYGPDCGPDGSIIKLTLTSGGTGYGANPTVTFSAPPAGGITAEATADIEAVPSGQLSSITVGGGGAGYTSAPTVSFVGVGTGATATAHIVSPGASVNSVTLTSPGEQCYLTPPPVSFVGGGSGATATAVLEGSPSCVVTWSVSGSCAARQGETVTGVELGGGSGFSGSFRVSNGGRGGPSVVSGTETIQNPGTGFTANPTSLTNLNECPGLTVTAVAGYRLASLNLTSGGSGYLTAPTVNVGSGAGTAVPSATGTATLGPWTVGGTVSSITLNNPGSGYTVAPLVVLTPVGLPLPTVTATATANLALTNRVSSLTLTNPGLGYTYNPTVTISAPPLGGITATARANRANGSDLGKLYLVTSMSMTRSGAKAMAQTELASPVIGAWFPGALTLNGPITDPDDTLTFPNSNVFKVSGNDANTCSETAEDPKPAVGGYDDPHADPATTSVTDIIDAIPGGRANGTYYEGLGGTPGPSGTPSVTNIYGSLGETMSTPAGLKSFMDDIADDPDSHVYGNDPGSVALGSAAVPTKTFVSGDLTLGGIVDGYGILAVTGKLTLQGNVHWHGIILVVGDGEFDYAGGGQLEIYGSVFV